MIWFLKFSLHRVISHYLIHCKALDSERRNSTTLEAEKILIIHSTRKLYKRQSQETFTINDARIPAGDQSLRKRNN